MLLIVLAVLAGVVAGALAWLGAFAPVQVDEQDMGPYLFVYVQDPTVDFGRIGELTEALGARLQTAGVTNRKPAQVFYPAGRGIPNQIGFVVDRAVGNEVLGAETFFRPIGVQRCAVARFPYRNPASFIVGYFRVDPALRKHRQAKKYAEGSVMVILEGDTIVYVQPAAPA
jgi:hypothetical protein